MFVYLILVQPRQCCDHIDPETFSHGCLREEESGLILWGGSQLCDVIGEAAKSLSVKTERPTVPQRANS